MRLFLLIAISLLLLTGVGWAAELSESSTGELPFTVKVEQEPVHFAEPVFRALVSAGTNKFTFIIPPSFHLGGQPDKGHLALNNAGGSCLLGLKIVSLGHAAQFDMDWYRQQVLVHHPGGKIIYESGATPATRGPVFDLEWKNEFGYAQQTRVIFVESTAGILEFKVTSAVKEFGDAQHTLRGLIRSFVASVNGKLVFDRPSGNT